MVGRQSILRLACCGYDGIYSLIGRYDRDSSRLHKGFEAHGEKRGMLLIADEAQTDMGRCGDLFAITYEGVVPGHPDIKQDYGDWSAAGCSHHKHPDLTGVRKRGLLVLYHACE